jgi:hypothetical protein
MLTMNSSDLAGWLDRCEAEHTHPAVVEQGLRRAGWGPVPAAQIGSEYRRRFNEHPLGYSALLVATGVAALAAGSTAHTLVGGLTGPLHRPAFARWLTLLVCALPFAVWAHVWAARVDREDPAAVWSIPRRSLAVVLLWAATIVGLIRLVLYVGQLIGALVGTRPATATSVAAGALNVAVVVGIAVPVWMWAFTFLHRFDGEDPTAPAPHTRRGRGAS